MSQFAEVRIYLHKRGGEELEINFGNSSTEYDEHNMDRKQVERSSARLSTSSPKEVPQENGSSLGPNMAQPLVKPSARSVKKRSIRAGLKKRPVKKSASMRRKKRGPGRPPMKKKRSAKKMAGKAKKKSKKAAKKSKKAIRRRKWVRQNAERENRLEVVVE